MIINIIFIIILFLILRYLFTSRSNHFIIPLLIFSYIFGGMLNENYSVFGRLPHELLIMFIFVLVFLISIISNKNSFLRISLGDKLFFFYYFFTYLLPLLANIVDLSNEKQIMVARELLPLKIWMIYRIFYYIYLTSNISERKLFSVMTTSYVWSMLISGTIGTLRMLNIPVISQQIENTWPFVSKLAGSVFRMQPTVGGVNGAGILFAISAIFALHLYFIERKNFYIYAFTTLIIFILLTASFSSSFIFIIMLVYWGIKNKINMAKIIKTTLVMLVMLSFLLINTKIRTQVFNTVDSRLSQQMSASSVVDNTGYMSFLPNSLKYRMLMWENYAKLYKEKPIFGYGYKILKYNVGEYEARTGVTESYFVELLLYSGFIGFLLFLLYYYYLIRTLKKMVFFIFEKRLLITILIGLFVSQISNVTFTYGGIVELFGIIIFFISIFYVKEKYLLIKNK